MHNKCMGLYGNLAATRANVQVNKKTLKRPPFWNKVYEVQSD